MVGEGSGFPFTASPAAIDRLRASMGNAMSSIISMPSSVEIEALIDENLQTLSQLSRFMTKLSPQQYRQEFGALGRHTVGKHVRHIIDHYDALLVTNDPSPSGELDYEHRKRDACLEAWPHLAGRRIDEIDRCLQRLKQAPVRDTRRLTYTTATRTVSLGSSFGRELAFLTSHTIHHMAIIGLLAESIGIEPPQTFGVHPSTLRHWQKGTQERTARSA